MDWFDLLAVQGTLKESSPAPQFRSINSLVLSLPYGPVLAPVHDHWKHRSSDCLSHCLLEGLSVICSPRKPDFPGWTKTKLCSPQPHFSMVSLLLHGLSSTSGDPEVTLCPPSSLPNALEHPFPSPPPQGQAGTSAPWPPRSPEGSALQASSPGPLGSRKSFNQPPPPPWAPAGPEERFPRAEGIISLPVF